MAKWLNSWMVKLFIIHYSLFIILLFLYSYTQVDLGLTLTRISIWQTIQKSSQHIGYFNRPLSTAIYLVLLLLLSTFYGWLLFLIKKGHLNLRQFWWLVGIMSGILLFSYNALSYDLFNYMFDAKIVTFYHANPYEHKALDFPDDPYLSFMHWTHRTYPYGPTWLALTIPLSFLGFQKFLPTLFLFKALTVGSFLGTVYFVGKIMEKINLGQKLFAMTLFAFNPLVILESLVSAHNETVMMFLAVWALYTLFQKRYFWAWILFGISVGIKFATVFLLPVFLIVTLRQAQGKSIPWEKVFFLGLFLMTLAIIPATLRTNLQPWYFLYVLPLVALFPQNQFIFWPSVIVSLGLLLHYTPFLYTGNWNPPVPTIKYWLTIGAIIISAGFVIVLKLKSILLKNRPNSTIK